MKKTMLKLGVIALTLVMVLACLAACGGDSTSNSSDANMDANMKVYNFNGTSFKYPANFSFVSETETLTMLMDMSTGDAISATSVSIDATDDEIAEMKAKLENGENMFTADIPSNYTIEEFYAEQLGVDVNDVKVTVINNTTLKVAFERVDIYTAYCTSIISYVIDEPNNVVHYNTVAVVETNSDYSLASKVFG